MTKVRISLAVFDLDGTLVNAYPAITRSFNHTMRVLGYPEKPAGFIRKSVGWGDKKLLQPFVRPGELSKALRIYRKAHARDLVEYARLMPGAEALLRRLKAKGIKLGVASNRPTKFAHILMEHLGIVPMFDEILCADALVRGKPHPLILQVIMRRLKCRPEETVFIGDMAIDALTAHNAHVRSIMVSTGSSTRKELEGQRPWRVVPRLSAVRW